MKNEITTTHKLDFESQPDPRSQCGLNLFRVGTCHGQWRCEFDAYEVVSVINNEPGNGHFEDVLQWFEHSARRDGKSLRFVAMMNDRLTKHLIEKRGFKPEVLIKDFDTTKPIKQLAEEFEAKQKLFTQLATTTLACDEDESLIQQCIEIVRSENKGSVSLLQRRLRLGYTRARRLLDELERRGIVSAPADHTTTERTVLTATEKENQK